MRTVRARYALFALVTIVAGLIVHLHGTGLRPDVRDVAGDALWAVMVFWWVSALLPQASRWQRALLALGACWFVELTQLISLPWLNAIRATRAGHLVLGSGFDRRDFAAYGVGILAAFAAETLVHSRRPLA
jgi:hypothetical protein